LRHAETKDSAKGSKGSGKNELVLLQAKLSDDVQSNQIKSKLLNTQNVAVLLLWNSNIITEEIVDKIVTRYTPFMDWVDEREKKNQMTKIKSIHFQGVEIEQQKIVSVKFQVKFVNEFGQYLCDVDIVKSLRVGMLIVLKDDTNAEYVIFVHRVSVADNVFYGDIPVGTLENGNFVGAIANKLQDLADITVTPGDVINLNELTSTKPIIRIGVDFQADIPAYAYRHAVTTEQVNILQSKLTGGLPRAAEDFTLKIAPLNQLWKETVDSKLMHIVYLYTSLRENGKI